MSKYEKYEKYENYLILHFELNPLMDSISIIAAWNQLWFTKPKNNNWIID